jgi:hypothetical protein
MDRRQLLVADSKTVEVMEPCMCAFDYPTVLSKARSVDGAPLRENRVNAAIAQPLPVWFGVVSTVSVDDLWLLQGSPANATNSWDRVYERQQLGDVVAIGPREDDRQRHPVRIGGDMVFGSRSRTIYGVWPGFWPAPIARTEDESTMTRERSIWPAPRSSASSSSCNRSHTPACCQSRNRRQHVTPEPQPISAGRSRQRSPVRNTNTMPFKAARSGTGFRPGYFSRRAFGCGSKCSILFHNSSSMIGLSMPSISSLRCSRLTGCPWS